MSLKETKAWLDANTKNIYGNLAELTRLVDQLARDNRSLRATVELLHKKVELLQNDTIEMRADIEDLGQADDQRVTLTNAIVQELAQLKRAKTANVKKGDLVPCSTPGCTEKKFANQSACKKCRDCSHP